MKLATWNVNSLKVRLAHVLEWLKLQPVDVLALQELKLTDDKFPVDALREAGYHAVFAGQKTYNGVALLIRDGLSFDPNQVVRNIPSLEDEQKRVITATVEGIRVISAYFPNGQAVGSEKFIYKLKWLEAMHGWLASELQAYPNLALGGDFNIAPEDRDVHDPAAWVGQNLVSPEERAAFQRLIALGLVDAYRQFEQPEKMFSWWDYRMLGFRRNAGLRIDHWLLSAPLAARCTACEIDKVPRKWEQPSDHAPVVVDIAAA